MNDAKSIFLKIRAIYSLISVTFWEGLVVTCTDCTPLSQIFTNMTCLASKSSRFEGTGGNGATWDFTRSSQGAPLLGFALAFRRFFYSSKWNMKYFQVWFIFHKNSAKITDHPNRSSKLKKLLYIHRTHFKLTLLSFLAVPSKSTVLPHQNVLLSTRMPWISTRAVSHPRLRWSRSNLTSAKWRHLWQTNPWHYWRPLCCSGAHSTPSPQFSTQFMLQILNARFSPLIQAPCPILQPPWARCCPEDTCCRNPVGCQDIGCCDPVCCPPPREPYKRRKPPCEELPCDPCKVMEECCNPKPTLRLEAASCGMKCNPTPPCCEPNPFCCDPRAHHLNRGPYVCPCKPEPDSNVYRCCESMSSSYAGHIPGFTFHSNGRTTGKATWGTKQYMNKCFYFNTFTKPWRKFIN